MQVENLKKAIEIYTNTPLKTLLEAAKQKRKQIASNTVEFCAIINARSGRCSENCKFCSQSIHYQTKINSYPTLSKEKVVESAKAAYQNGAKRFSLVTSGRELTQNLFDQLYPIYQTLQKELPLQLCASHGFISETMAQQLKEAGVSRYHHNLETGPQYYSQICTTHSYQERILTLKAARAAGLSCCSGGIWGMNETVEQRLAMAFELKKLAVDSVPINILTPIQGTPLEKAKPLSDEEILKSIALYRLILPSQRIRIAGGRSRMSRELQTEALQCGVDALMIGNYLTTTGLEPESDLQLLKQNGFTLLSESNSTWRIT